MEQFSLEKPYDRNANNWRKSVDEITKYIYDRLDDDEFFDFLVGADNNDQEDLDREKRERWQTRLDDLNQKITKRMGYRIDQSKLLGEALEQVRSRRDLGELTPSNRLDRFYERSTEWLQDQKITADTN